MSTTPRPHLYGDVADRLEADELPFPLQWIQDRGVTLGELRALQHEIALVLRGYAALHPAERIAFVTRGVLTRRPIENQPAQPKSFQRQPDSENKKQP